MTWRLLNLAGFVLWLSCVPAAALFGWYHSIPFVALASIYANAVSHLSAWRADANDDQTAEIVRVVRQETDLLAEDVIQELDRRLARR